MTYASHQGYVFLVMLYGGLFIGLMYDVYRIFRGIFRPKKIATTIQDLVFWIGIAVLSIIILIFGNEGKLRFYTFLGLLVGCLLYYFILSKFFIEVMIRILKFIKRSVRFIIGIMVYPLHKIIKILRRCTHFTKEKIRPLYKATKKISQRPKGLCKRTIQKITSLFKKK